MQKRNQPSKQKHLGIPTERTSQQEINQTELALQLKYFLHCRLSDILML